MWWSFDTRRAFRGCGFAFFLQRFYLKSLLGHTINGTQEVIKLPLSISIEAISSPKSHVRFMTGCSVTIHFSLPSKDSPLSPMPSSSQVLRTQLWWQRMMSIVRWSLFRIGNGKGKGSVLDEWSGMSKKNKTRIIGKILLSFGLIMWRVHIMNMIIIAEGLIHHYWLYTYLSLVTSSTLLSSFNSIFRTTVLTLLEHTHSEEHNWTTSILFIQINAFSPKCTKDKQRTLAAPSLESIRRWCRRCIHRFPRQRSSLHPHRHCKYQHLESLH